MLILEITTPDGTVTRHELPAGRYRVGKSEDCDIFLADPYASRHHADIVVGARGNFIRDNNSTNGIWKGTQRSAKNIQFKSGDRFRIGDTQLHFIQLDRSRLTPPVEGKPVPKPGPVKRQRQQEQTYEQQRDPRFNQYQQRKNPDHSVTRMADVIQATVSESEEVLKFKRDVHLMVLEYLDLHKRGVIHQMSQQELRLEATQATKDVIASEKFEIPTGIPEERLIKEIVAEAVGLGPLEPFLEDDSITELMVNGKDRLYVERAGKLSLSGGKFNSDASLMGIIDRIVTPLGRRIDEGSPMVDARLPDGSRVNVIIPPLALDGPNITIRKFSKQRFDIQDLIDMGSLSHEMAQFLAICVDQRMNIVVSGGTGSGKTTTLNVLSNFIPDAERIVTIEDAAELRLNQEHVVCLESRPANVEGKGLVTIRDLVRNSLRMRPDRIVVGECRGGEALDMLQAMNTGHDGSMTTGHANSARDILSRLEVMTLMSGIELPVRAIREQISSAINIIVQQSRFSDGKRRITSIVEVTGMEGDVILMQKIFEFRQTGRLADGTITGEYVGFGYAPSFYEDLEAAGEAVDRSIFGESSDYSEQSEPEWEGFGAGF